MSTIFHKIRDGEIPAEIVYEDEHLFAFKDIAPQAPVHVLFIPKKSIATLNDLTADDAVVIGKLFVAASSWAKTQGFAARTWRCARGRRCSCAGKVRCAV